MGKVKHLLQHPMDWEEESNSCKQTSPLQAQISIITSYFDSNMQIDLRKLLSIGTKDHLLKSF